jgi:hypothetical protein
MSDAPKMWLLVLQSPIVSESVRASEDKQPCHYDVFLRRTGILNGVSPVTRPIINKFNCQVIVVSAFTLPFQIASSPILLQH